LCAPQKNKDGYDGAVRMLKIALWGLFILAQQAGFTMVSRARNSTNLWYSGTSAAISNGLYYVQSFFLVKSYEGSTSMMIFGFVYYIVMNVIGGVLSHKYVMKFEAKRGLR
jgi:hypothetical protein